MLDGSVWWSLFGSIAVIKIKWMIKCCVRYRIIILLMVIDPQCCKSTFLVCSGAIDSIRAWCSICWQLYCWMSLALFVWCAMITGWSSWGRERGHQSCFSHSGAQWADNSFNLHHFEGLSKFLYDDMCKFFFNFCLSLFFSSWNIPIKNLLFSIWSGNDVRLHLLNQYVWNWYGRTIDYKINYFISPLLPLQGQNEWKLELFIDNSYEWCMIWNKKWNASLCIRTFIISKFLLKH